MNYLKPHISNRFLSVIALLGLLLINSCIEPYEGSFGGFDDTLVVNAILTNENKKHEIQLARSYQFDEDGPTPEQNAVVTITDSNDSVIEFQEISPGTYASLIEFAAVTNNSYFLSVTTEEGKSYRSDNMELPKAKTQIDQLYAERITNDNGVDGMGIFVDTFDPTKSSNYYRYEFLETYKIIAPLWSPRDIVLLYETVFDGPYFEVILREQEERLCYGTDSSKTIDVINTSNLSEDRLSSYRVHFVPSDSYTLTYRYSILVRQYIQSPSAFEYYAVLKGLSQSSTDLFSEDQPGFLAGNIFAIDDAKENVAGFFEVATVDEKRIFFNYEDFYEGEELPPYYISCEPYVVSSDDDLAKQIKGQTGVFYDTNGGTRLVSRPCGDCTALGSNKKPEFWVD